MNKIFDCVVSGACVVDLLVRPVPLDRAISEGDTLVIDGVEVVTGGVVCNSGIALARLGAKVAALGYVGDDDWAAIIRRECEAEGLDVAGLVTRHDRATSMTVVLINSEGEHAFAHSPGACARLDGVTLLAHLDLFASSRSALFGYYSLLPELEQDFAGVLEKIRGVDCLTALETAGGGGSLQPLDRILPHLDVYVPSLAEAASQSGESDPEKIIRVFRGCGSQGLLGVKLGEEGALLSPRAEEYIRIAPRPPPGPVVDTTGAGDSFYAGLLAGLVRGWSAEDAGKLAAAAGACCVTGMGASVGIRSFDATARRAGLL